MPSQASDCINLRYATGLDCSHLGTRRSATSQVVSYWSPIFHRIKTSLPDTFFTFVIRIRDKVFHDSCAPRLPSDSLVLVTLTFARAATNPRQHASYPTLFCTEGPHTCDRRVVGIDATPGTSAFCKVGIVSWKPERGFTASPLTHTGLFQCLEQGVRE